MPLTISAQDGLVDQITYFNNRVASRDVSNYYLVYNGEFAYNKSTSDGYPFGAVKRLDWYEKGVLSTLYIVFALKHPEKDDSDFMTVFYDTDRWHRGVAERAAEGARNHGLLNISADDFFDIDTTMPEDKVEQEKIGRLLKKLDTLITLHQRKYEKLVNIKKSMLDKMFPQNGASVPEIRFKGFTDPWEQRKLGDITVELSEYATQELGLPLLTSSRSGLMYQDEYRDSRTTKSTETLFSVVPVGTCTYRHMSDDDVFHMNINTLEKGLVSREYPVFEASKGNNLEFLVQHINSSEEFKAFCAEQKKGGTRTRLYYNTLCQFTVRVPALKEQAQISQCLKKLDTLITLHQRKYEKLVNIKKSMLDKMFPKNGASVPEIRFKGFTDPWEQRKLKELYFQLTERNADLLPYQKTLSVATMSFKTDGNGAADTSLANYKRLRTGDIAFEGHTSKEFRYGRFVLNDVGDGIMSPRFSALRPLHEMPINFWKYYIHYEPIMRKVLVNSTKAGTMMNELVINEFLQESILVPSVAEQQAIGRFFKQLDTLITLHQRKLEKLQNIKKSCLEKMFV